MEVFGITGFF